MAVRPETRLFTVEEYYRMAEAGILGEDDRVELIHGEIVKMNAIGSYHAACVDRLTALLSARVAGRAIVRVQSPVRLGELSQPEPDLALLRPRADYYREGHPGAAEVLLLIEVADTSLGYDRTTKASLYAETGVSETWIVDLEHAHVETLRHPGADGFAERLVVPSGFEVSPLALPDIVLAVADILG